MVFFGIESSEKYKSVILCFSKSWLIFQDEMEVSEYSEATSLKSVCVRAGCNNPAVESNDWDKEYCSNECVANHCRYASQLEVIASFLFAYLMYNNFFRRCLRTLLKLIIFCFGFVFSEIYSWRGAPSRITTWGRWNKEQLLPTTSNACFSTVLLDDQRRTETSKTTFHCKYTCVKVLIVVVFFSTCTIL